MIFLWFLEYTPTIHVCIRLEPRLSHARESETAVKSKRNKVPILLVLCTFKHNCFISEIGIFNLDLIQLLDFQQPTTEMANAGGTKSLLSI